MMTGAGSFSHRGFTFQEHTGTWSLTTDAGRRPASLHGAGCRIEVDGRRLTLAQAASLSAAWRGPVRDRLGRRARLEVTARFLRPACAWTLTFEVLEDRPAVWIEAAFRNEGASALTLGDADLLVLERRAGGRLELGPWPETERLFAFNGGPGTQQVKPITADGGRHQTAYLLHLHQPDTRRTLRAGFLTFDRLDTLFTCRHDARARTTDCLATCRFQDYALAPGAAIAAETLSIELGDDPYAVLTQWADDVARRYRLRPWRRPTPVGWIGWSWVDQRAEIPERQVEGAMRAIRERLAGFGVNYLWVSIANLKDGLPGNWLEFNRQNFPRGFRRALRLMIRRGFKPGLWVGPFYVNAAARAAVAANRGNLLADPATGQLLPRGRWLWAHRSRDGQESPNYALDGSHPASQAFLRRIFQTYRRWGVRYYMLDFLDAGRPPRGIPHHDRRLAHGPAIPRQALLAIRRAAGPDTHLLTASGSTLAYLGTADTMRLGLDYGEGRSLQPRFKSYPATYVVSGSYGSCGTPHDNCLQNTAAYFFAHRRLFLMSQNLLTVDHPIPRNEAELSTTLFGMTGSPVMLGDALDRIADDRLALIKTILPRPADWPFPADLFRRVAPDDYARVLVVPVTTGWGAWSVVAVFNLDDRSAETEISMSELRLPARGLYRVWDFWHARYDGCVSDTFRVAVPPKSCRLLRLSAVTPHPWVLGTDLHVRQGQFELRDVAWESRAGRLRGVAVRPRGERGTLYLAAPPAWKPADYRGLFVAKDARDSTLLIRVPLEFRRGRLEWAVSFSRLDGVERDFQRRHGVPVAPACRALV